MPTLVRLFSITGALAIGSPHASAQPPNDTCSAAIPLVENTTISGTTIDASTDPLSGTHCTPSGRDVYYSFIPSTTGLYQITLCDTSLGWNSVLSLHTGCPATPANEITCNDDTCEFRAQMDALELTAGTHYIIRVAGSGASPPVGDFTLAAIMKVSYACYNKFKQCIGNAVPPAVCPYGTVYVVCGSRCVRGQTTAKGACCQPGELCILVTPSDCTGWGGVFSGAATSCMVSPCGTGACCDPLTVTCALTTGGCGGVFLGDGTTCSASPCTFGACCCGSSCAQSTPSDCSIAGGHFAGVGSTCDPFSLTVPCCRGDFNHSGLPPAVDDVFSFLAAYFGSNPCADTNDNGVLSVQDLFDFLAAYFGGC